VREHFYAEVLAVLRRQFLGQRLSGSQATVAVARLGGWHLRRASVAPLVPGRVEVPSQLHGRRCAVRRAAEQLRASLLTDDHRLAQAADVSPHR
jgi:hypothetical protein